MSKYADKLETESKYGGLLETQEVNFKLHPTEGNLVALIDADLLPYKVGFVQDPLDYLSALKTVEEGHAENIFETSQFKAAAQHIDWLINYWVSTSGADAAKLFLTDSPNQFRFHVAFTEKYKDRTSEKPPFFYELKQYLTFKHKAIVRTKDEADDAISIEMWKDNYALQEQGVELGSPTHEELAGVIHVGIDKDIWINAGRHFNPDQQKFSMVDELGWLDATYSNKEVNHYEQWYLQQGVPVDPASLDERQLKLVDTFKRGAKAGTPKTKRVLVGKRPSSQIDKLRGAGLMFFYSQLITGDDVDGYSGLKGKGKTYAYDLLVGCKSERELYNRVLGAYKEHYGARAIARNFRGGSATLSPYQFMLEQGRLAHMSRFEGDIWRMGKGTPLPLGTDKGAWR